MLLIHDGNAHKYVADDFQIDGDKKSKGLVPRNFASCPVGSLSAAPPFAMKIIPLAEYKERLADQIRMKRLNSHYRRKGKNGSPIPSLDQNGKGYCWAHSVVMAIIIQRAIRGLPYIPLSAYMVACIIKRFRDEGGWCGEALEFLARVGVCSETFWPQRSMDPANDNEATRADAALHIITEGFYDLGIPIWNQKLSYEQSVTCHLLNIPTAEDFNWWGHSVCMLDLVDGATQRFETRDEDSGKILQIAEFDKVWAMNDPVTAGFGRRGINSWGDSFGDLGEFVLTGSKAVSNGAVAVGVAS